MLNREVLKDEDLNVKEVENPIFEGLSESTRERIQVLQEEKQRLMTELRKKLESARQGEIVEFEGKMKINVGYRDNGFYYIDQKGEEVTLTEGELLTGGTWGISYQIAPEAPLAFRKEYILSEMRRKISYLLDLQIATAEAEVNADESNRRSFAAVRERLEKSPDILQWDQGHIAEAMLQNMIVKWVRDQGLPVELIPVDLYEDVEDKIDFIVRKRLSRGVRVESEEEGVKGIQFTLMHRKDAMEKKRELTATRFKNGLSGDVEVDDILVTNMHPSYVKRAVNGWKKSKNPGGPDSKLEKGAKVDVFIKIFDGLLSEEELADWRERILG